MVPSGYKEDTVYSVVPSDGSGDLSFTRASNGTRINSAGLVEVCPWNLAQQSETFDNAIWGKSSTTIVANAEIAPNGTMTADTMTVPDSTTNLFQAVTYGAGEYTFSVYVKVISQTTGGAMRLQGFVDGANVSINFTPTTEWQLFTATYTATTSITSLRIRGQVFVGTLAIWGAQLNIGSTAKPYFPTTDRLNVPRLTYQNGGGGCPSLLLEKQSTNYILQSQNFTTFWSFANLLYTANQAISPDGTQNATKLDNTTGTGQHRYFQLAFTGLTNQTLSFSLYAKQGTHRYISWGITDDTDYRGQVVVDLQTGTITDQFTASATLSNLSVVSQGNGWYRISGTVAVSANYAGGNAYGFGLMLNSASWSTASYTGTETYFYGWGAQAELSSYPTSYIPTTSSSATRVADECSKTGISSLIGQTEGVLFVDFVFTAYDNSAKWIAFLGGGTAYVGIYAGSNNEIFGEVYNASTQAIITFNSFVVGTRYKMALAYKANDFAFYVNGVQIGTDSSGTVPTTADFNFLYSTTNDRIGGKVYNQLVLFKNRLTNAELASLTTI